MLPDKLASIIIVLVTLIWIFNFVLQFAINTYKPDASINTVFGLIVGGAFALKLRQSSKDDKSENNSDRK